MTIPLISSSLRQSILHKVHDAPGAGHLGVDKTLEKACQLGYWVSMYEDVVKHCQECASCQQEKLPSPSKAPLVNVQIGRPWQMVAVDVLPVPPSFNNNRYLLVIQDYFTARNPGLLHKWVETIHFLIRPQNRLPMPWYRSSAHIACQKFYIQPKGKTLKVPYFSRHLRFLVFISLVLQRTIQKGMAWWNVLIVPYCKCCKCMSRTRLTGSSIFL